MRIKTSSLAKTLALAAVVAALALAFIALPGSRTAHAYPTGWTSDNVVATGCKNNVDVAARGNNVYVVYKTQAGTINFTRSLDRGVTWSAPVRLDLGSYEDYTPQIEAMGSGMEYGIFVVWTSNDPGGDSYRQLYCRASFDYGVTWTGGATPSYFDYTTSGHGKKNPRLGKIPNGSLVLVYSWYQNSENEIYYCTINEWTGFGNMLRASEVGSDANTASVAGMGANNFWIAYEESNGSGNRIRVAQCDGLGVNTRYTISDYQSGHNKSHPDIVYWPPDQMVVVWNDYASNSYDVYRRSYDMNLWQSPERIYYAGTKTVYPRICEYSLVTACEERSVSNVVSIEASSETRLMQSVSPFSSNDNVSVAYSNPYTYIAVAGDSSGNGTVYLKRTDSQRPEGRIAINGMPSLVDNPPIYTNKSFSISFYNMSDDWGLTGTDKLGDCFTNGVTSVSVSWARSLDTETWSDLAVMDNAPWKLTRPLGPDGNAYIKGTFIDTAGNRSQVVSGPIIIDTKKPDTSIASNPKPNDNGWINKPTKVTLTASDANPSKTEYLVQGKDSGGGANWKTYNSPFTLPEGIWTVSYRSRDKAGNIEETKSKEFKIDTTAPVCSVTRPARDTIQTGYSSDESFRVTGTGTDANGLTRAAILIDGEEVYSTGSSFDMAFVWKLADVKEGLHRVEVRAEDPAGNVGAGGKNVFVGNVAEDWYFAEGNTLPEFDEYICLVNPGDRAAAVDLNFMLENGEVVTGGLFMEPHQRRTLRVKDYVEEGHQVSCRVHSEGQIVIAERPMYFVYKNKWKGGHNCMGLNVLQNEFYFAEGTTRKNGVDGQFEEWICLMNPDSDRAANVTISYMLGTGQNVEKHYQVGAHSRRTIEVAGDVGLDSDVSCKVTSDIPIAAERPMYFDYHGYAVDGSDVVGATSPSTVWYFAEGSTYPGFQEWLTIQNPNDVPAEANITYMTGSGRTVSSKRTVPGNTRVTVDVLGEMGDNENVSARIESDVPVVAERPMYFVYGSESGKNWTGGESAMGTSAPSTMYYLAEGCTIDNFDTWYTLQNPEDRRCGVVIQYVFGDGSVLEREYSINPHSRLTVNVNDAVEKQGDVSGTITASFPIIIERPMYFNYKGTITGGHNVCGYGVD